MFKLIDKINNPADSNELGSVAYEYYMSEFPVSNTDYCEFLNSHYQKSIFHFDSIRSANQGIDFDHTNGGLIFFVKKGYENVPVINVSYQDALHYLGWLNKQNSCETEYRLPSHNEWYKAAYFDRQNSFYNFPLQTNTISGISIDINAHSFNSDNILGFICNNGLFNLNQSAFGIKDMAGNVYELIKDDSDDNYCTILGASWNRNFMNSHKSNYRKLHKKAYNDYTGFRICKTYPSRQFKIGLYNSFGDGWYNDYISITDACGGKLIDKASLNRGSGPQWFEFSIYSNNMIIIEYCSSGRFYYDNFYEIYDSEMHIRYKSKTFNGNNNKQVIILN